MAVKLLSEIWRDRPTIYLLYYLVGGIYTSEEFSKCAKWSYFAIQIGIIILNVISGIGYLITVESSISFRSITALLTPFMNPGQHMFYPLLILYLRHDIIKILDFVCATRKEVLVEDPFKLCSVKRINISKHRLHLSILWYSTVIFCGMSPLTAILLDHKKSSDFSDLRYHVVAVPYLDRVDTVGTYCVAYFLEMILCNIIAIFGIAKLSLVATITGELNNIVVDFCKRIQSTSLKYETEFGLHCETPRLLAQFDQDVTLLIKEHRVIYR